MHLDACQAEAERIWLVEAGTKAGMEVEIEAEIITPKHQNTINTYTMNHILVMRLKCGKVEIDQIQEILEMTQEKTKCLFWGKKLSSRNKLFKFLWKILTSEQIKSHYLVIQISDADHFNIYT